MVLATRLDDRIYSPGKNTWCHSRSGFLNGYLYMTGLASLSRALCERIPQKKTLNTYMSRDLGTDATNHRNILTFLGHWERVVTKGQDILTCSGL
jgi:hypothetical protein